MNNHHKLLQWNRHRSAYILVFLLAFFLTELGRNLYRPFVYSKGLNDLGIADTIGNHLGAVTLVFFTLAVMNATRQEALIVISVVTFGYIGYEFVQQFLPGSTADSKDVVASIAGGILSLMLFLLIDRLLKN
jgi:VanZ family protein